MDIPLCRFRQKSLSIGIETLILETTQKMLTDFLQDQVGLEMGI